MFSSSMLYKGRIDVGGHKKCTKHVIDLEGGLTESVCCAMGKLSHLLSQTEIGSLAFYSLFLLVFFFCLNLLMNLMRHPGQTSPNLTFPKLMKAALMKL